MKFIIESSPVPIYNRIAIAFTKTLMEFGHTVHFINASDFDESNFINTINNIDIDYYISTNELNYIHKRSESMNAFLFEKIQKKIIFIHHDNIFSSFNDLQLIVNKIKAFSNIAQNSFHFCLESSNVDILIEAGISNASKINHASEFRVLPDKKKSQWGVTFIGHLMSSLQLYPSNDVTAGGHMQALAWSRFSHSSYPIQPQIDQLAKDSYVLKSLGPLALIEKNATKQFLISSLNKFSSPMRGQLISTIRDYRVDIFGGDLSYGRLNDSLLILRQKNIHYQPATQEYQSACDIYKSSRININISALQFDTAVNNRFFDIILSGGFILTDKRNDLAQLSNHASEISFDTPEEMNDKIAYFSDSANNTRYFELRTAIHEEISEKFTYRNTLNHIMATVESH